MSEERDEVLAMIPTPAVVRALLSRNVREGRLLRAQLRVSILAAEERYLRREGKPWDGAAKSAAVPAGPNNGESRS